MMMYITIDLYFKLLITVSYNWCSSIVNIILITKASKAGLNKPSVLEKRRNPNAFADMKFRRDALQGTYYQLSISINW